ncbi:GGDEF domain-containing protein [Paludibacterium yongneupense]|uniref:GGDEF domain-containing protein n=1 Tax=Paludibacterium yongneupense TaxID=400061 RepID=UPI000416ECDA|nr:GGDEF domain-containing protein [Paludibacterium yongneupense]
MRMKPLHLASALLWLVLSGLIAQAFVNRAVSRADQRLQSLADRLGGELALQWQSGSALLDSYAILDGMSGAPRGKTGRDAGGDLLRGSGKAGLALLRAEDFATADYVAVASVDGSVRPDPAVGAMVRATGRALVRGAGVAVSPPFVAAGGRRVYLRLRPRAAATAQGPRAVIAVLAAADALTPDLKALPAGAGVRLSLAPGAHAAAGAGFFERRAFDGGWLARRLLPRLEAERHPAMTAPMLRLDWQPGFEIVDGFEWAAMSCLSLALSGLLVFAPAVRRHCRGDRFEHEMREFYQANHDRLTGLANRNLFYDRMQHAIARLQRNGRQLAIVFLDLDRFTAVNDTLGQAGGDQVLRSVAGRMRTCLRGEDTVARFGGDEFVVMLEDIGGYQQVERVLARLKQELERPYALEDGRSLQLGVSIGTAYYPDDGERVEELLTAADRAMYGDRHEPVIVL